MDTLRAARYPFLDESRAFADKHSADIVSLIMSPAYAEARKRGMNRVLESIRRSEVSYVPLSFEHERLMEVMSYPYARMLVSCVDDRFLTKRYALAESVRMSILLVDERSDTVVSIAKELRTDAVLRDGMLMMHFTDYLKLSSRIKSIEWKLVNSELFGGNVFLSKERFCRALQNAMQDKIESELPLPVPNDIRALVAKDVKHIELMLNEMKTKFGDSVGGDVMVTEFPPCIRALLAGTQNGMNLPHSGRFALVSFLHALGMDSEQIMELFSKSPDFDASKSAYQVRHITGEGSGTEYTPPECSTMKSYGICFEPDDLCGNEKVVHPLIYYRIKTRTGRRDAPEEKKE
ncbi:MAG: DNA primase large subunit PriL [Methanomassiliicoccaceae archaeon]|jgi:DNA primase large subunit|nr:DNA primase large subunit PriL [Methanomassiliicoccaceae archaeon]